MKAIWKFPLEITHEQEILVPRGSSLLTVQTQNDIPCVWLMVDPDESLETRRFIIHGTGHKFATAEGLRYLGTSIVSDGALVWHIFEKTNENT